MPSAVKQVKNGQLTIGDAWLGADAAGKRDTVAQAVHDGDTVTTDPNGNISVRFLAIDTPEVSFTLPNMGGFPSIKGDKWKAFLSDPFAADFDGEPMAAIPLDAGLRDHLEQQVGPGCAENHADLAEQAHRALEEQLEQDIADLTQDTTTFRFFLAFAHEVMDGYGRFLAYIHPNQPDAPTANRKPSYNRRMLDEGYAAPYFIWPNLDPYRPQQSLRKAVPEPGGIAPPTATQQQRGELNRARAAVRAARDQGLGIYDAAEPLRLLPFELRYLSSRKPPHRWVIDLSTDDADLFAPQLYYTIQNPEDRLFVPDEYRELFESAGWVAVT